MASNWLQIGFKLGFKLDSEIHSNNDGALVDTLVWRLQAGRIKDVGLRPLKNDYTQGEIEKCSLMAKDLPPSFHAVADREFGEFGESASALPPLYFHLCISSEREIN